MNFIQNIQNGGCTIDMKGKFTFSDHNELKSIFEIFKNDNVSSVVINLKEVEFVDSAALGLLLLLKDEASKASVEIALLSPLGQVKKMFEISKFYDIFNIKE